MDGEKHRDHYKIWVGYELSRSNHVAKWRVGPLLQELKILYKPSTDVHVHGGNRIYDFSLSFFSLSLFYFFCMICYRLLHLKIFIMVAFYKSLTCPLNL